MGAKNRWIDTLRALVGVLGLSYAAVGAWALISPHGWYRSFPGFGRHWLSALGPYNEHFARDAGAGLLAVGVLMVWVALAPRAGLLRPALVAALVFGIPHLAYHVGSSDHLATGDNIVNLTSLALAVIVPAALLWATRVRGEGSPGGGMSVEGGRVKPVSPAEGGPTVRWAYRYSRRRYGTLLGPLAALSHHPALLRGTAAMELALQRSNEVDRRLKDLAATRAAQLAGCPFCIDYGYALLECEGAPQEELAAMANWRESELVTPLDRLVLEYAEAMTHTPAVVSDELYARLREQFSDAQLVELTGAIAFENHRSRMNQAFRPDSHKFYAQEPVASGHQAA